MRKMVVQSVLFAGVVLSSAGQAADLDDVTMMVIRSDDKRLETITNRIQIPDRFSMRDRAEHMDKEDKGAESTRSGHDRHQHGADSGSRSGERHAVTRDQHDQKEQSREGAGEVRDSSRDQALEHKENISNSAQEHKDAAAAEIREEVESSIQERQESTH